MSAFEIDPSFYARFGQIAVERTKKLHTMLADYAKGGLAEPDLRAEVAHALHDFTGEARMLGFLRLAKPASELCRVLRDTGPLAAGFWVDLGPWLDGLLGLTRRVADHRHERDVDGDSAGMAAEAARLMRD